MPQLDFIIIFPQIFWLIVVFFFTYAILIHFFLPIFLKSLKIRKYILVENSKVLTSTQFKFDSKQRQLNLILNANFNKIKVMLEAEFFALFSDKSTFDLNSIDTKIVEALYYNILYHDLEVLDSITLNSTLSYVKFDK